MLQEVRDKCIEIIKINKDEKYIIIKELLSDDECFFKIPYVYAIEIIKDLGYTNFLEVYEKLINSNAYNEFKVNID